MKYVLAAVTIILGAVVVQPAQAGVERPKIRVGLYETTNPITVVLLVQVLFVQPVLPCIPYRKIHDHT